MDAAIRRQIVEHSLVEIALEPATVDWRGIISRAVSKQVPFSPGGDKDFKDAIVLETFNQLVDRLPKSGRILMLTSDIRLGEATKERMKGQNHVQVVSDLAALQTILNALASHIDQDTVEKIVQQAAKVILSARQLVERVL